MNLTLLGQMGTFAVLVFFIHRFLWGPVTRMMEERSKRVADGLAAAERGRHERELAEQRAKEVLHEAKEKANEVISQAQKRATEIVEEAKGDAREEGERILTAARTEVGQEVNRAKEELREHLGVIVVTAAERVLKREIDAKAHADIIEELAAQI